MIRVLCSADGAPNACCAVIRQQLRESELPPKVSAHMDAGLERLIHAFSDDDRPRSITAVVTLSGDGGCAFSLAVDPIEGDG